ncbi:FAD-binding domain-containing protein [Punctularia strigosozonata HHB-11173 SS5]|uniref:FAD-binding domain-containing protein n=1 Tax=Punctularia strigosozonata (strain HHB-11173) TaxID=741275 RepID=R7S4K7_PUNST|nr:FAD-binding domain-containing protein [Punctularia strigosozonata HHB-11173 SS5]EIN04181.1 FAD-binding domain-containing protein [Punctularia strigosozonata HHB-11173 SS5]
MATLNTIYSLFRKDQVFAPEDGEAYRESIRRWAENAERNAQFVVFVESAADVSKAITFATKHNLDIAIKGGGHSCSGASSSEGLVIDMGRLNSVRVDEAQKRVIVGGGALWADVDVESAKYGLAAVAGTVNHTGVGGFTLGGGYGWLTPKYGLAIDNLVEAEVVLADGSIVSCSEEKEPDLFWAIRGAGSNFGAVTSFTFRAHPQKSTVWAGLIIYPPTALAAVWKAAETWVKTAGEDSSLHLFMACPPPAHKPTVVAVPFFNGSAEEGKKKFGAFYDIEIVKDLTREMPYSEVNGAQNMLATHGDRKAFKSTVMTSFDPARYQEVFNKYSQIVTAHPEAHDTVIMYELHPFEKVAAVPNTATSFANRGEWYNINFAARWKSPELDDTMRAWAGEQVKYLRSRSENDTHAKLAGTRAYANYGLGDEKVRDIFGDNYDRLAELKVKYDPDNVFHKWYPVASQS